MTDIRVAAILVGGVLMACVAAAAPVARRRGSHMPSVAILLVAAGAVASRLQPLLDGVRQHQPGDVLRRPGRLLRWHRHADRLCLRRRHHRLSRCHHRHALSIMVNRMDEGMSELILLAVPMFIFLGLLIEMIGPGARR